MKFLLDTNICIEMIRRRSRRIFDPATILLMSHPPPFVKAPSGALTLDGGIHVWRFPFGFGDESLLSREEALRAAKFQAVDSRAAFVAGRSGVRRAASLYSKIPPADLVLESGGNGKPHFENAAIHFNLSHSGATVVAAFSGSAVGIDIEMRGRCRDFAGIAKRFFHPAEAAAISSSNDESHFLRLWTGKEAMLKLSGEGISGGLCDARPGDDRTGMLRDHAIHIVRFAFDNLVGAVASFQPGEVKGWFEI